MFLNSGVGADVTGTSLSAIWLTTVVKAGKKTPTESVSSVSFM